MHVWRIGLKFTNLAIRPKTYKFGDFSLTLAILANRYIIDKFGKA
jgi:hypothetical protein